MENAKDRAIDAIKAATIEGPVRVRTIKAVAQIDTSGKAFKLFLDGTRRQGDAVLKALKEAGVITTVRQAKPGVKAQYAVTDEYKEEVIVPEYEEDATEAELEARYQKMVDQIYPTLDELQESWELSPGLKHAALREAVEGSQGYLEGKLGDAVDSILWALIIFPDGVTAEDFSLEGESGEFSERTLKSAIATLKAAGVVGVRGAGRQVRKYYLV